MDKENQSGIVTEVKDQNISRPPLISYKEFKEKLADSDGFEKRNGITMRIIFYDPNGKFPFQYRFPVMGQKELAYKAAYYFLFICTDEYDRRMFIQEGQFKYPLSFNFARAFDLYYPLNEEEILKAFKK